LPGRTWSCSGGCSRSRGTSAASWRGRNPWEAGRRSAGPDVTASPDIYADAEFRVLGEAEDVLGEFVACPGGRAHGRGSSPPLPFPISPAHRSALRSAQARALHARRRPVLPGLSFNCEFCNCNRELNGRVPRHKSVDQMITELEYLYRLRLSRSRGFRRRQSDRQPQGGQEGCSRPGRMAHPARPPFRVFEARRV